MNIGEEIVVAYLQYIKECEFVQTNLYTPDAQGEMDVVGIDINKRRLYVCEVAIHLSTGLLYSKDNRPNNVKKFTDKFSRNIEYANKYFDGYEKIHMLWSPIVKNQAAGSKYNQMEDINNTQTILKEKYDVVIDPVINERFQNCLGELRDFAKKETKDIKSPVIRLMQVEEALNKHLPTLPPHR